MRSMQVAVKAGKPFAFATLGVVPVFGLTGQPEAALGFYELLDRPAICHIARLAHLDRPALRSRRRGRLPPKSTKSCASWES